jgi:large-conductance mechanosensitive channel
METLIQMLVIALTVMDFALIWIGFCLFFAVKITRENEKQEEEEMPKNNIVEFV